MSFLYKKLIKYLSSLYFKNYTSNDKNNKDITYLVGLVEILRSIEFDQSLVGFNSKINYVKTPSANIELLILTLIQLTSALDNKNIIFRNIVQVEETQLPIKTFLTNKNNEQLIVQQAINGLIETLQIFTTSLKKAQGDENQISKTNVFLLIQYTENLCVLLESIITIQLNS